MKNGFTLIEFMIVGVIIGIAALLALPMIGFVAADKSSSTLTYGFNGIAEVRCIEGYKFIVSHSDTRQVMDEFGKGVKCQ